MKFLMALVLVLTMIGLIAVPLSAHHGDAIYDITAKNVTMKGTVAEWVWANPHCVLRFDVTDGGQVSHWVAETTAPPSLIQRGWTKQSLKPGDEVTVTVLPAKNGRTVGRLIEVVLPDGQKLPRGGLRRSYRSFSRSLFLVPVPTSSKTQSRCATTSSRVDSTSGKYSAAIPWIHEL